MLLLGWGGVGWGGVGRGGVGWGGVRWGGVGGGAITFMSLACKLMRRGCCADVTLVIL